ncbi:ATP-dependent helicase HrpB [Planctomicrobium piriforme]|uniref:ATP-dependent helicase HrpB n=1 Tax=Planctomicrobium piriforme TaxID=1576369 RepID=A0A1I3IFY2_9PLAN|nr:ATP-dependent helicase HrpB [Planctomicrobium piriforme]SFI46822.1 ATP-dependent helicase HrpB [Planctomicrobium piriforme]
MLSLPIDAVLPEIVTQLRARGTLVLRAPTGAGKTTRVPPALLDAGLASRGQIVLLEPRRIAARAAAARMARERDVRLGIEIGYQVRFDSRCARETRIVAVTEGILLRKLQTDPFLEGVDIVVFDEFHERNLSSDLALGMVRRVQQEVRPDLKIVVMSATLDPGPIAAYLGGAPTVESLGRTFPVSIEYLKQRDRRSITEAAAWGVEQVFHKTDGHILVFLPGVGEIHKTSRELEEFARRQQVKIWPLYGDLPPEEQDQVLAPSSQRKIVLATNVAETSVTIDGVTAVVDTGVARVLRFDPLVGLDRLEIEPISQSSADQRAGRAGRTAPGICLRLWEEVSHRHRPEQTEPEIRRVDLSGPLLQLKSWGEPDALLFPWFEPPRADAVAQAELLLHRLGACDCNGRLTELGSQLAQLPTHPRLARLLLAGQQSGEARRAAWLAALLEERDPFMRPRPGMNRGGPPVSAVSHHSQSDVLDRLGALEEAERGGTIDFPWGTLHRGSASHLARVRDQLLRDLRDLQLPPAVDDDSEASTDERLLRALVTAFPDRVAKRRAVGSDKGIMVGGRGVKLGPQSCVRTGELFLCTDVDAGQTDAIVRQASLVLPEWLPPTSLRTQTDLFFHPTQKQVVARRRDYFEDLILSETPCALPDTDAPAEVLFHEAAKAWDQVFPSEDDAVKNYLARVQGLARWMPELELPRFEQSELHAALHNLSQRCRSFADLKRSDWLSELQNLLTWPQRQAVEREAPERFTVPSGSAIRLQYEPERPPVLAVKIQEIFGLTESPRIAAGRVRVLLHLLGPNMRPQQVTDDLASFWSNTYPAVRKELARRYPRHNWPENPLTAKAGKK